MRVSLKPTTTGLCTVRLFTVRSFVHCSFVRSLFVRSFTVRSFVHCSFVHCSLRVRSLCVRSLCCVHCSLAGRRAFTGPFRSFRASRPSAQTFHTHAPMLPQRWTGTELLWCCGVRCCLLLGGRQRSTKHLRGTKGMTEVTGRYYFDFVDEAMSIEDQTLAARKLFKGHENKMSNFLICSLSAITISPLLLK